MQITSAGGRTRGGERRRAGGGSGRDFTAPRDAASEDDEEDGVDGGPVGGASPSGRSTAAAPPGFGGGSSHAIGHGFTSMIDINNKMRQLAALLCTLHGTGSSHHGHRFKRWLDAWSCSHVMCSLIASRDYK